MNVNVIVAGQNKSPWMPGVDALCNQVTIQVIEHKTRTIILKENAEQVRAFFEEFSQGRRVE